MQPINDSQIVSVALPATPYTVTIKVEITDYRVHFTGWTMQTLKVCISPGKHLCPKSYMVKVNGIDQIYYL